MPHDENLSALVPMLPLILSYVLSFVYVGIYWNNHHHMLHTCQKVNGAILWANMHLLFWLSLIPFTTGWMGENHFASIPTLIYGLVLLMAAIAYWILQMAIIKSQGEHSLLQKAIGKDIKGKLSPFIYLLAMLVSYWVPYVALALYVFAALIWVVPDQRIEKIYLKT